MSNFLAIHTANAHQWDFKSRVWKPSCVSIHCILECVTFRYSATYLWPYKVVLYYYPHSPNPMAALTLAALTLAVLTLAPLTVALTALTIATLKLTVHGYISNYRA